jgi:hypothetical protein
VYYFRSQPLRSFLVDHREAEGEVGARLQTLFGGGPRNGRIPELRRLLNSHAQRNTSFVELAKEEMNVVINFQIMEFVLRLFFPLIIILFSTYLGF